MSRIEGPWDLFTDIAQPPSEPGRPEIVLLAGFLGLHLARPDGQRLWLTPPAFALRDVATELSLGSDEAPLVPDGLNEIFYSDIVRDLRREGFVVHALAFDFRRPVLDVARDLAAALAALGPGRRFVFVAHSMGALVAALYPYFDPAFRSRVERAIFLGGTVSGSFEVVDAALGAHPIIARLSDLSIQNGPDDYAACMRTWPGLYDMLPDPAMFDRGAAAFEAAAWADGQRPDPSLLAIARETRRLVDASPLFSIPTAHILSVRFSTGDAYAAGSIAVRRPRRAAGDGTITARAAMSRGGPVYRVDLPHTLIPLDPKAISGVIELARTGATSLPLVSEEEANAPIEGREPTVDDIVREYAETTLTHPERILELLKLCLLFGPPGA